MTRQRRPQVEPDVLDALSPEFVPIALEVHRLWAWCVTNSKQQFTSRSLWNSTHILTTGTASILAAATGVSALTSLLDRTWIGVASLLAAVLAGLSSLVSAKEKSAGAADAANTYIELR